MSLEEFKTAWKELELEEARRSFLSHLAAYVIVNCFLVFVNIYTNPGYLWFPWVLVGWGVGLAFHYVESRPSSVVSRWEQRVARIEMRARRMAQRSG